MASNVSTSTPIGLLTAVVGEDSQYPEIIVELDGFQIARVSYYSKETSNDGEPYVAASIWTDGGWGDPQYWTQIPIDDILRWKQQLDG